VAAYIWVAPPLRINNEQVLNIDLDALLAATLGLVLGLLQLVLPVELAIGEFSLVQRIAALTVIAVLLTMGWAASCLALSEKLTPYELTVFAGLWLGLEVGTTALQGVVWSGHTKASMLDRNRQKTEQVSTANNGPRPKAQPQHLGAVGLRLLGLLKEVASDGSEIDTTHTARPYPPLQQVVR
jgi:hypothetical protein